jgi:hypothetical protein
VIQNLDIGLLSYASPLARARRGTQKFTPFASNVRLSGERPPSQTVGTVLVARAGGESRRRFTGNRAR